MKKIVVITVIVLVAIAAAGVGIAYAQGNQPSRWGGMMGWMFPQGGMMGRGGGGWMHDYVEQALASKLGLTEEQVEDQLAAGKSMYQIALDAGTAEADIPALLTDVHKAAFDKAVADGVMTRQQADLMLQHMQGNWTSGGPANCPLHNGGYGPQNGSGYRGGPGMMGQGGMMGRWLNQ